MAKQDLKSLIDKAKKTDSTKKTPIQKIITVEKKEPTKPLHIHIPEDMFYELKKRALEERASVKDIVNNLIYKYINDRG